MSLPRYKLPRVPIIVGGVEKENLGSIYSPNGELVCKTMEQAWRGNQKDDKNTTENDSSCIPEGVYIVEWQPPSFGRDYEYYRFRAIAGRTINKNALDANGKPMSSILMHPITFVKDLLGCVGVGSRFNDFNKDGIPDMEASKAKLKWMTQNLPKIFELEIFKK